MTNKVKLIKSFAGYPVWEYQLNLWEYCYIKDWSYKIHPDIVEWMPSYFEEVKEEWRTKSKSNIYYYIDSSGDILEWYDSHKMLKVEDYMFEYWNYFLTHEWAKAVSDLRKHVYKFPMCRKDESNYAYYFDLEYWSGLGSEDVVNAYYPDFIHHPSTEEDRAERLRLINECIKHNWYLTI